MAYTMPTYTYPYLSPPHAKVTPPAPPPPRSSPPFSPPLFAPPPLRKLAPPPPILIPPPPHITPSSPPLPAPHHTVIIIVFVSLGGLFFLAFLAAALCCFVKKKKKTVKKSELVNVEDQVRVHEVIVPGPHGQKVTALSIDEDIKVQEAIKKNELTGEASSTGPGVEAYRPPASDHHHFLVEHKGLGGGCT